MIRVMNPSPFELNVEALFRKTMFSLSSGFSFHNSSSSFSFASSARFFSILVSTLDNSYAY